MRKPTYCISENKDADQLHGNLEADQRLCFPYTDSTIPLLPKSEISSLYPSSVAVQPGLCGTRSEIRMFFFSCRSLCLFDISVNCWPNESGNGCDVNIEYELEREELELNDVVISIPVP